jgi:cytochrome c oxidase subunit II
MRLSPLRLHAASGTTLAVWTSGAAWAQAPRPWEMGMQPAASEIKQQIIDLHFWVLILITLITLFVGALLAVAILRFRASKHPTPSRVSHHTWLEIAWTVLPAVILVALLVPSLRLVYFEDRVRDADLTIKVTGHQWNWEYTYPDNGNIDFASYMIPDDQLKPGQLRLLDVDNQLVLPVGKNIRILQTSVDVIHSFFIPSLGLQRYAIPGRIVETWVNIERPGTYYGECNQICGTNHSRMPISIKAVPEAEFEQWLKDAKTKYAKAGSDHEPEALASADARSQLAADRN